MLDGIINNIIPCAVNAIAVIYILSVLYRKRVDFKDYKLYLVTIILVLVGVLNYLYVDSFVRILVSYLIIAACGYLLFKPTLNLTIMVPFIEQIIMFISEVIFTFFSIIIFSADAEWLVNNVAGSIVTNIYISIIAILLMNIKWVKDKCYKLIDITDKIDNRNKLTFIILFIITINIFLMLSYFDLSIGHVLTINIVFIIIYSIIILVALNQKNENIRVKIENESLMVNLNEYEKMLDYQRVNNHENKNQLLIIKDMVVKKDRNLIGYIDEIIKDKREDNEILMTKTKKIPTGGLQGIIYQKTLLMQEKHIKVNLQVSRNIKELNVDKMSSRTNYNVCKILGVFLDNAIEETEKVDKKEITVSMYTDDCSLIIEISNYFKDHPNLEMIYEKGYTTKGKGHGYGLSLVKEIIDKNRDIENEREIVKNIFTQKLKIKM